MYDLLIADRKRQKDDVDRFDKNLGDEAGNPNGQIDLQTIFIQGARWSKTVNSLEVLEDE